MKNEKESPCLPEITDADLTRTKCLYPFVWLYEKRHKLAKMLLVYPFFTRNLLAKIGIKIESTPDQIRRNCGC